MLTQMLRLLLIALLIASPRAFSQEEGGLGVRFLAERCPVDLGPVLMAAGESESASFDLPTKNLSKRWTPPARVFQLRAARQKVNLANITLPDDGNSFVVLLVPTREGGYKPVSIRTDLQQFRAGNVYFYNHSPEQIFGQVGTAKFNVEPGTGLLFEPAGARKENFYDVGFFTRSEKGFRPLSVTRWPVDDKVRTYVFFYINPVRNRLDFRTVDEFIPLPATASNP